MLVNWTITVRLKNGEEYHFSEMLQDIDPKLIEEYERNCGWDVIRAEKKDCGVLQRC